MMEEWARGRGGQALGRAHGHKAMGTHSHMIRALRAHWPEYCIEALCLGLFMVSAGAFTVLFEASGSPVRAVIDDVATRRALIGIAMGLTAVGLIYSPFGRRSGAHMNPAVTLTFLRLGKVDRTDAAFYIVFQIVGGAAGALLASLILGRAFVEAPVSAVATVPGPAGAGPALVAEAVISFVLMLTVLAVSNSARAMRFTGLAAGTLVALFIAFEAPVSGMSMNPSRTLASSLAGGGWTSIWVYFIAPPVGMLLAAEMWLLLGREAKCAKLNHAGGSRCIFRCGHCRHAEGVMGRADQTGGEAERAAAA